jgi:hypothetical protein
MRLFILDRQCEENTSKVLLLDYWKPAKTFNVLDMKPFLLIILENSHYLYYQD